MTDEPDKDPGTTREGEWRKGESMHAGRRVQRLGKAWIDRLAAAAPRDPGDPPDMTEFWASFDRRLEDTNRRVNAVLDRLRARAP